MKVKRIMSNTATSDFNKAKAFYGDILGLDLPIMDHGSKHKRSISRIRSFEII